MAERELATITYETGYQSLVDSFRARAVERRLALTSENLAAVAGLPNFYICKLLSRNPVRRIGAISLGPLLGALALKLVVTEDEAALAKFGPLLEPRKESCVRVLAVKAGRGKHQWVPLRLLRKIAPLGAAARNRALSPARRSQIARKAARARWARSGATSAAGGIGNAGARNGTGR